MQPESETGRNGRPDHHVVAAAREVAERASAITRLELELAKLELKRKAGELGAGVGLAIGAAVLLVYAIAFLFAAAAAGIATALPWWGALLIVFGALVLIAVVLVLVAEASLQEGDAAGPGAGDPRGAADARGDRALSADAPRTPDAVAGDIERERERLAAAVSNLRDDFRTATNPPRCSANAGRCSPGSRRSRSASWRSSWWRSAVPRTRSCSPALGRLVIVQRDE